MDRRPSGRGGGWGANHPSPWFAEVGPPREGGYGRDPRPLDNSPTSAAGRSRVGPKGAGPFRSSAGAPRPRRRPAPRAAGYGCRRAAPDAPGPRRGRRPLAGLRAGRASPAVVPLAVAGFVLAVRGLRARGRVACRACVFGVGFYFTHIFWMRAVGHRRLDRAVRRRGAVLRAAGARSRRSLARRRLWPLWVARGVGRDGGVRSAWPFSGMPWGRLAFAVVDTPVADALPYVGSAGVSFLLALSGALLARLVLGCAARARLAGGRAPWSACWRWPRRRRWRRDSPTVDGPRDRGRGPGRRARQRRRHPLRLPAGHRRTTWTRPSTWPRDVAAGRVPRPDFVVWPENSTAVDPFLDAEHQPADPGGRRRPIGVPILVGAIVDAGPDHVLNQGIVWDPVHRRGRPLHQVAPGAVRRVHPVPRASSAGNFGRLRADPARHARRHPHRAAAHRRGRRSADAICFDVAYDDGLYAQAARRRASCSTVQTSNATFIHTDQIDQQFAISRLRAIETGRYVVVAATNGVSGIIAPDGQRAWTGPAPAPGPCWSSGSALVHGPDPGGPDRRRGPGRLCVLVAGLGVALGAGRRIVGGAPAGDRRAAAARQSPARTRRRRTRVSIDGLGRVVMVIPTYNEAANLAWIVDRLRARPARRRRAGRRRRLARRHRRDRRRLAAADPQVAGAAPHREGRPRRGVPARLRARARRRLRRDRRDGRRRLPPARAAATGCSTRCADADLVIGSRWVPGGSVVNWPRSARGALARRQPLRPAAARDPGPRRHRRLPALPARDAGEDRPRPRCGPPATSSRPTWSSARLQRRAAGARGADRVRRAGARRLQDERRGRRRVAAPDHPLGPARARAARCAGACAGPATA